MQIHHNFICSHTSLDGKTPSKEAGIKIEGENNGLHLFKMQVKITIEHI